MNFYTFQNNVHYDKIKVSISFLTALVNDSLKKNSSQ
jgi:hypothetical protein